jgi:hypothetical protein
MAYQAIQSFYIANEDGTEAFVRKGAVYADGHPYIKRDVTGTLFEKLNLGEEDTPKTSRGPAKAAK